LASALVVPRWGENAAPSSTPALSYGFSVPAFNNLGKQFPQLVLRLGQQLASLLILRHCGLWEGPIRTLAAARGPPAGAEQASDESRELQLVLDSEYL